MNRIDWKLKPKVVLILGDNQYLKDRELRRAIETNSDHQVQDFSGSENADAALASLNRISLFASKKLVVIHAIEDAKSLKKAIAHYCSDPKPDTILVLVSGHRKKSAKWIHDLKHDVQITLSKLPSWDVPKWLVKEAKGKGLVLPQSFAEAIVLNVGEDLYSLANEIEKLALYCGSRSEVLVSDIEAVLFQHTAFSPFDVTKLWGMGDNAEATRMYLKHLDQTPLTEWMKSVLVILGSLQDGVEMIMKAKDYQIQGLSRNEIAKKLGKSPFIYTEHIAPQIKVRTLVKLEDAYIALADIEARIKSGGPGKLLLESFLLTY